jgi:hypothetical protein
MLTVPMFARYMTEVTAGQPLQDIPWARPPGVKADDKGGTVRTTMEEVAADAQQTPGAKKPPAPPPAPVKPKWVDPFQ